MSSPFKLFSRAPRIVIALPFVCRRSASMAVRGDSTSLQQNAIPSVASNFAAIEAAIKENHANWAGAQPAQRPVWLLQAPGTEKIERAEFLCGVFGAHGQTANSAVFVIPNLPPGNYAVATFDVASGKNPQTLSFVLQQIGSDWKVGGFYAKPSQIASHDGNWFAERAREFKVKGHTRNAWLYFMRHLRRLSRPSERHRVRSPLPGKVWREFRRR